MTLNIDAITVEGMLQHKSLTKGTALVTVSASTLNLIVGSEALQVFSGGTVGQIVKMPDATTLQIGWEIRLHNDSTTNIAVQNNANAAIVTLDPGQRLTLNCISVASAAGVWTWTATNKNENGKDDFQIFNQAGLVVTYSGGVYRFNGTLFSVAGGSITLPASSVGSMYVDVDGIVKATANIPDGAMPIYSYTTGASAIISLNDAREEYENNNTFGVAGDISGIRTLLSKNAGVLNKYARADHTHDSNLPLYKTGTVTPASFTGTPRRATVTFGTAMPNTSYSIRISGNDSRLFTWESKTTGGFVINSNAALAITGNVDWEATVNGESI